MPNASRTCLGSRTGESESLVDESEKQLVRFQSTAGHVKSRGKTGGPPSKPKYYPMTDSEAVL